MSRPVKYEWHRLLIEADGLTPTTKLVALALWDYAHADGGNAHPGNRLIAGRLNITERAVQSCLERLREARWITRTDRPGDRRRRLADVYRLTLPTETGDPPDTAADLDDLGASPPWLDFDPDDDLANHLE